MSDALSGAPHVSVVMPVYNGGRYLAEAVDSVLAQTYRNFEIVLVNDGSSDAGHTDVVCRRYAEADPDRIIYVPQRNAGVGAALNTAVANMRGAVFCWLSHDDLFEANKLERQVDFFARLGKSEAMLFSDYRLIDAEGRETAQVRLDHATALRAPRFPLFQGWVNGCTIYIPKLLFPSTAPFDPQYRHVQDYRLWLELLDRAELFHQPELLVRYRVHAGQDSRKPEATAEGDALWIDMIDRLGPTARCQIAGSDRRFYENLCEHLELSRYPAAAAYAAARRDDSAPDTSPEALPGADLLARIESLRSELDERLRFVSDARYFGALPEAVSLAAGALHREHAIVVPQAGVEAIATGVQAWAYVASLLIERRAETTLLQVEASSPGEESYVLLVDETYKELAPRQAIAPAALWFDIEGLPTRIRLVVQAGAAPKNGVVKLRTVILLEPDPALD